MRGRRRPNLGSAARRHGFWLSDRLRGAPVRHHYDEIRATLEHGVGNAAALDRLLAHAGATTPFYAPYRARDLGGFPVIDKATLKADPRSFRSSAFDGAKLHRAQSSGSTGEPIVVDQDQGKRRRSIADTIVFNELAGYRLGDRLMWLFAARLLPMSRRKQFVQNLVAIDHVGLDDGSSERVLDHLLHDRIDAMLGINSTYQVLARHIRSRGLDPARFGLKVVIATAEDMLPEERVRIGSAFGCPVVNRYSTEEHGMFATTRPDDERMLLNRASYRFEFLKLDSDEPQLAGELARVVVTDLYNRATPIIRYDTGDLAIVGELSPDGEALSLESVAGRRRDVVYDTSGGQVPSTSVSAILVRAFPQMQRYQLIQEDRTSFRVLVVQGPEVYHEADIAAELRRWLGSDASIDVESVAAIAPLASGKHRPVVRHYDPRPALDVAS